MTYFSTNGNKTGSGLGASFSLTTELDSDDPKFIIQALDSEGKPLARACLFALNVSAAEDDYPTHTTGGQLHGWNMITGTILNAGMDGGWLAWTNEAGLFEATFNHDDARPTEFNVWIGNPDSALKQLIQHWIPGTIVGDNFGGELFSISNGQTLILEVDGVQQTITFAGVTGGAATTLAEVNANLTAQLVGLTHNGTLTVSASEYTEAAQPICRGGSANGIGGGGYYNDVAPGPSKLGFPPPVGVLTGSLSTTIPNPITTGDIATFLVNDVEVEVDFTGIPSPGNVNFVDVVGFLRTQLAASDVIVGHNASGTLYFWETSYSDEASIRCLGGTAVAPYKINIPPRDEAVLVSFLVGPYNLSDGDTVTFVVDGASTQVTFSSIATPGAALSSEIAADIMAAIPALSVHILAFSIEYWANSYGLSSTLTCTGGTAKTELGL